MSGELKNLFVFVPSGEAVEDFKTKHVGSGLTSSDKYFNKVSFLSGSGEIAAHGELFGMSTEFKNRLGLTNDITTSNTLMTYITGLGSQLDTLNGSDSVNNSVDKKIKTAIDGLIANAPTAYDTITEIAAWLQEVQGEQGTATAVAQTLAKVGPLERQLGGYTVNEGTYTYTGAYLFAHDAATDAVNSLNMTYAAEAGKYISAMSLTNGVWNVTKGNLPTLTVAQDSQSLVTVSDHEITLVTTNLGSTSGISHSTSDNVTTYTASNQAVSDGLITASAVYNRIHATEVYLATTLTDIDARILSVSSNAASGAIGELDSHITLTAIENGTSYGSITIVQHDGELVSSDGTNTASLTINKSAILAETSATVDSPTTGTGANEYIQVHVTEENHKVTSVTVDFDPWEVYTVQSGE